MKRYFVVVFLLFVGLTPYLFLPNTPVVACSEALVNLVIKGDPKATEFYIKSRYMPTSGSVPIDDLLTSLSNLDDFGVTSYKITASSLTDAVIIFENQFKVKRFFSLKVDDNLPCMIINLQEVHPNLPED